MSTTISGPIKRHGGKSYLAAKIVALMPPHVTYVEPFAGGLAVLFAREPEDNSLWLSPHRDHAGVSEIVNDLDARLINFWRVLRNEETFTRFFRQIEAMPVS